MKLAHFAKKHLIKLLFTLTVTAYAVYLCAGFLYQRSLLTVANRFVEYFYVSFNSGSYNSLYKSSAFEGCKCSVDMDKFKGAMETAMLKMGPVSSWKRTSFEVSNDGRSERVMLRYRVAHERAESFERFTMVKRGEEWVLAGYNVYSEALKE